MDIEFDTTSNHSDVNTVAGARVRRGRLAAGVGAVALVAAAGGAGFGLGSTTASESDDALLTPGDTPATEAPAETTPQPSVTAVSAPVDQPVDAANGADDSESAADTVVEEGEHEIVTTSTGWTMFQGQPTELLAERTTDAGLVIRAHLGETWNEGEYYSEPGGWTPPGWCFESGQLRVALGGGESTGVSIIDVGSTGWWNEPYLGRAVSPLTLGAADGNPHRLIVVQAPSDVTNVTVTFGDGSTDSTTPQNGIALLAVPGAPEFITHDEAGYSWHEEVRDFEVVFDGASGADVVSDVATDVWNDPGYQASCSPPPPELPAAGEQPADAPGAEQTITELMSSIYGSNADGTFDTVDFIDDPTGVEAAREQVREGGLEESAASAEAIVEELVFTSPTEAWFRYRIETINGVFQPRFGIAVDIDGVWKITRDTICQDLQMAGGSCGNDIVGVYPDM